MSALFFITLPVFDDLASPRRFMKEKQTWSSDRFSGQSGLGIIWHEQHWVLGPSLHTEKWYFHLYTFTEENPSWRGKDYKWWGLYTIQCIGGVCVSEEGYYLFFKLMLNVITCVSYRRVLNSELTWEKSFGLPSALTGEAFMRSLERD